MSKAAARLRAIERRRPVAEGIVIVSQDLDQPEWYVGPGGERFTEQQLESLAAGTMVIKVCYE